MFHLGLLARITCQIRLTILVALECVLPAARPYWKGYLKPSFVSCPVALYPATSAAEQVSFRQVNTRGPSPQTQARRFRHRRSR